MLVFLEAILHSTNTFFAVSRPETIDETITKGRAMLAPTIINFNADQTITAERINPFPTSDHWPQLRANS